MAQGGPNGSLATGVGIPRNLTRCVVSRRELGGPAPNRSSANAAYSFLRSHASRN